ncbi:hypothetical protein CTTA_4575 [Comamonas testosteroni]|uniref:Uncharacterized protein n=1 Tax=Comamonas testosteroni TaxID=285 RepID=A0A5A7MJA4_COMTE|nr:hypothetical protein [Comamonas testosteroni]GEQ77570.1 hypothetical protein CTTA_4575 [Comamonas testosteroni]
MYESHSVCHFFREWGFREGLAAAEKHSEGNFERVSMLGNMQNKFDAVFGDVALTNQTRFQLIEFKQDAEGFAEEVKQGKKNRTALHAHLQTDITCRELSLQGHVAGYVEGNVLRLDPYYALCAGLSLSQIQTSYMDLAKDFDAYYDLWNPQSGNVQLHAGLDSVDFKDYVKCMYQHLETDAFGVLQIFSEKKNAPVPFYGSVKGLIADLLAAFTELEKIVTKSKRPGGP